MSPWLSSIFIVLLVLNLVVVLGVGVLVLRLTRTTRWYANVSIPWFNNIGQKIGLDNAQRIPEQPISG